MLKRKTLLVVSLVLFMGTSLFAQNEYIGAAKCKMCHNKPSGGEQYAKWAAGPHAKAMDALKGEEKKNPKCLKCHSTYFAAGDAVGTLTEAEGVSCESCHGAGSGYKTSATMKDQAKAVAAGLIIPNEKVCVKCHNKESPKFKGFDYATYSKKIAHPRPAE